jgi:hypothetical protein
MTECNTDEILKQLKVLESLKQLRENMGNNFFMEKFPELNGLDSKLDTVIEDQETELQEKMSMCGQIEPDEIPMPDTSLEPTNNLEVEPSDESMAV